jgi:site-specific DNA-methyltransferase (adenine-specific)
LDLLLVWELKKINQDFTVGGIDSRPTFNLSKDNIWETPPDVFEFGCNLYNFKPEIDVCATAQDKKCELFIGEDSLNKEWNRDFWMNPPYSNVKDWIKKAYFSHIKYNVSGLALLFAKTDTKVWHECILHGQAEVYFIQGRIKFFKNGVVSKNPAPYPSAFVFWRAK